MHRFDQTAFKRTVRVRVRVRVRVPANEETDTAIAGAITQTRDAAKAERAAHVQQAQSTEQRSNFGENFWICSFTKTQQTSRFGNAECMQGC